MSEYQKLVKAEAKKFFDEAMPIFEKDDKEFGGRSAEPNLPRWLDHTQRLKGRVEEILKGWNRAQIEMVQSNSRNAVAYGDPKESAFFAFFKDLQQEVKKLKKHQSH